MTSFFRHKYQLLKRAILTLKLGIPCNYQIFEVKRVFNSWIKTLFFGRHFSCSRHTDLHIIWNGTWTVQSLCREILRPHAIPAAIGDTLFSRLPMPGRIQLVLWRTCLKLKHNSVWNVLRTLLIWIRSSKFGTCSDDALLWDQGLFLLLETLILHFLWNGTAFLKVLSISSSHSRKTDVQQS